MKQLTVWIVSAVFLMLVCPCLVAAYAGGAGMASCLLLFFALCRANRKRAVVPDLDEQSPHRRFVAVCGRKNAA